MAETISNDAAVPNLEIIKDWERHQARVRQLLQMIQFLTGSTVAILVVVTLAILVLSHAVSGVIAVTIVLVAVFVLPAASADLRDQSAAAALDLAALRDGLDEASREQFTTICSQLIASQAGGITHRQAKRIRAHVCDQASAAQRRRIDEANRERAEKAAREFGLARDRTSSQ